MELQGTFSKATCQDYPDHTHGIFKSVLSWNLISQVCLSYVLYLSRRSFETISQESLLAGWRLGTLGSVWTCLSITAGNLPGITLDTELQLETPTFLPFPSLYLHTNHWFVDSIYNRFFGGLRRPCSVAKTTSAPTPCMFGLLINRLDSRSEEQGGHVYVKDISFRCPDFSNPLLNSEIL